MSLFQFKSSKISKANLHGYNNEFPHLCDEMNNSNLRSFVIINVPIAF